METVKGRTSLALDALLRAAQVKAPLDREGWLNTKVYQSYPSVVVPIVLGLTAICVAITRDLWMLLAIRCIVAHE